MPQDITFQIVTSAPSDAIISLYQDAGWWKESQEARDLIPNLIAGSFCFMIAALPSGEIIGMGRVLSDGVSDAYIQDVVVRKAFQGQGIGGELVKRLTQYCRDRRLEWIGLVAEPNKSDFYSRLGFKELKQYVPMRYL